MGDKPMNSKGPPSVIKRIGSDYNQLKSDNCLENVTIIEDSIFDALPVSIMVTDNFTNTVVSITFVELKESASGSFGTVFEGYLENNVNIAVKKVLQDRKYKNRELDIMKRLNHNNITSLLYFFYSAPTNTNEIFLNLIMDFVPQTINRVLKFYFKNKSFMPMKYIKIYAYQILRGMNYIHQMGVCHRDIKPQNLLVNPSLSLIRICDFGSAKYLISTETNVSYICSRYYRAPELIFGSTNYDFKIDMWSVGCVIAEILLNKPLFPGESSIDQLVEIIKILGSPSKEEINDMNEHYKSYNLPVVSPCAFDQLFTNPEMTADTTNLLLHMLEYSPLNRVSAIKALLHSFFDELRSPAFKLDSKQSFPALFDFSLIELTGTDQETRSRLIPKNK